MYIDKDGIKFGLVCGTVATLSLILSYKVAACLFMLTFAVLMFFRNPKRYLPLDSEVIVSPAEGTVVDICSIMPPSEYGLPNMPCTRIGIFLNIFDVHVTRSPVDATVTSTFYEEGRFLCAYNKKASDLNEKNTIVLSFGKKRMMAVTQIAGLIARRIRCDVEATDVVKKGGNMGLIRFGSRVDIYFDSVITPLVAKGHRVRVGETALFKVPKDWL